MPDELFADVFVVTGSDYDDYAVYGVYASYDAAVQGAKDSIQGVYPGYPVSFTVTPASVEGKFDAVPKAQDFPQYGNYSPTIGRSISQHPLIR